MRIIGIDSMKGGHVFGRGIERYFAEPGPTRPFGNCVEPRLRAKNDECRFGRITDNAGAVLSLCNKDSVRAQHRREKRL